MSFNEWREVVLKDVIDFNPKESIKKGTLTKKIGMDKLAPFQRRIDGFELEAFTGGSKFRNGDTLLARITPCLENGKTAQVTILDDDEIAFGSTEYIVLRNKKEITDNNYIFYLALSQYIRDTAIKSMTGTSGRQRAQTDVVENTKIMLPPLEEQKAIAHILSTLDDKIEVNSQINRTLENIAQVIFKQWFVDFEFPNEDGEPYKSSGGEMFESDLGMIPKGWEVGTLKDIGEIIGGGTPSKSKEHYFAENGIPWITPKDLSNNKNKFIDRGALDISEEGLKNSSAKLMPEGTVLFSSRAPIGYIAIAKNPVTTNQGFKSIVPRKLYGTEFVYRILLSNLDKIESRASGSTFKEISGGELKKIEVVLPTQNVINNFNLIVADMSKLISINEDSSKKLTNIRDSLLPKLMSGEIRVPLDEEGDAS
ncbi:restriction endonuclease subunit S [Tindallia californiensis]|uniref:Type I restriction enzyme, S subunit n=1 Tax=Tindallia californiensis TaxID=159292 RepID=A0A1H3IQ05_9FIRM|nr:restriction endonuclease subunit S [Tindallia californiensis]SDY29771.1 type I restriction enzyme, S subunit [Tindallia californiensis]